MPISGGVDGLLAVAVCPRRSTTAAACGNGVACRRGAVCCRAFNEVSPVVLCRAIMLMQSTEDWACGAGRYQGT